jgi:hypothetical protein
MTNDKKSEPTQIERLLVIACVLSAVLCAITFVAMVTIGDSASPVGRASGATSFVFLCASIAAGMCAAVKAENRRIANRGY